MYDRNNNWFHYLSHHLSSQHPKTEDTPQARYPPPPPAPPLPSSSPPPPSSSVSQEKSLACSIHHVHVANTGERVSGGLVLPPCTQLSALFTLWELTSLLTQLLLISLNDLIPP